MINKKIRNSISGAFAFALLIALLSGNMLDATLAAHGGLDNSFDGNGRLATDFNNSFDVVTDMVVQPDGKIVVVGVSGISGQEGIGAMARYNVDGSLDTTFSDDGKLTLGGNCKRVAVAMRPNSSSIVIAYYIHVPDLPTSLRVLRLLSNGTADNSFDGDGVVTDNTLENFALGDVVLQNDGKIIVVGGSVGTLGGSTPASDWLLWRFNQNGSFDTGFSGDGRQQTDFGGNLSESAASAVVLQNGALIVGGTGNPGGQGFALARYTTNGSLDTNWGGGDGKVFTDISGMPDIVYDLEVQADDRILLCGSSFLNGFTVGAIVRYDSEGVLDNSFAGDGIFQTTAFGPWVEAIAVQKTDGKIIGVGGPGADFIVGRLNTNGTPDTSFGTAGFVTTDMNNGSDDESKAIAISFDRRIVVAGSTLNTAAGSTRNFGVARYLPTNILYHALFDFDGDDKSDYGIFRPSNSQWWINRSSSFTTSVAVYGFGLGTDRMTPADFTGDGRTDVAVFRPSTGTWYVLRSENFSFYAFPFGTAGDIPAPADYDADGEADAAVFRPSTGTWYISQSSGAPTQIVPFGINGDQPVVADYDEDGKADVGIFRPGQAEWWIQRSTAGLMALQFGLSTDKAVPGDYTGDGKADVAIFRPSTGEWYIVRSDDGSFYGFPFGTNGDIPAPADYDGDGRFDVTVVRGTTWLMSRTTAGTQIFGFGVAGDRPITNAYVP